MNLPGKPSLPVQAKVDEDPAELSPLFDKLEDLVLRRGRPKSRDL